MVGGWTNPRPGGDRRVLSMLGRPSWWRRKFAARRSLLAGAGVGAGAGAWTGIETGPGTGVGWVGLGQKRGSGVRHRR